MRRVKVKPLTFSKRIKVKGKYYVQTFRYDYTLKRYVFYKRKKWKPFKMMWRLTIAVNYYEHWVEGCLKIQAFSRRKSKLKRSIPRLEEELMKEFEKRFPYPDEELWFEYQIGYEIEKVPFDPYKVETETDVKDEIIKVHKRK